MITKYGLSQGENLQLRYVYHGMWDNLGYGESTPQCIGDDICGCTSVSLHPHFQ